MGFLWDSYRFPTQSPTGIIGVPIGISFGHPWELLGFLWGSYEVPTQSPTGIIGVPMGFPLGSHSDTYWNYWGSYWVPMRFPFRHPQELLGFPLCSYKVPTQTRRAIIGVPWGSHLDAHWNHWVPIGIIGFLSFSGPLVTPPRLVLWRRLGSHFRTPIGVPWRNAAQTPP